MPVRFKDIRMPELGPIRWRRDGYGTQVLKMPSGGDQYQCAIWGQVRWGEVIPSDPIQRGYVKIWCNHGGVNRVIDRALTTKSARKMIGRRKQRLPRG